jgi:hypothetical protein
VLSNGRVELESASGASLAKGASRSPARGELEPTEAGEAYAKSRRCAGLAMKAIDPETREMYLSAARQVRKAAGL